MGEQEGRPVLVKEGQKAPEFELPSAEGGQVALKDHRGKPVVLYFYPKLRGRTEA